MVFQGQTRKAVREKHGVRLADDPRGNGDILRAFTLVGDAPTT